MVFQSFLQFLNPNQKSSGKVLPKKTRETKETLYWKERVIQVKRRPRLRRYALQVSHQGEISVRVAIQTTDQQIFGFIQTHEKWLLKKLVEIDNLHSSCPPKLFVEGESFLFLGSKKNLKFSEQLERKRDHLQLMDDDLIYFYKKGHRPDVHQTKKMILSFYEKQARLLLAERVELLSHQTGLVPKKISFRSQKTRWGSCSPQGAISLNWRLLAAPLEVMDYVILHELCHLKHLNHSSRYWSLVEQHCSNYKHHKKWLRDHQHELNFLNQ